MKKNKNGFTLLEVLIASAILSIVLTMAYTILLTTLNSRGYIEKRAHTERIGNKLLSFIGKDIQGAYMYQIEEDNYFLGQKQGKNSRIDFVSNTDSILLAPEGAHSDICEVGYFLRSNRDNTYKIIRREDFFVDQNPLEGGTGIKLCDEITSFELVYYENGKPSPIWNSKEKKKLPDAVEIKIGILDNGDTRIFSKVVPILSSPKIPKQENTKPESGSEENNSEKSGSEKK